MSSINIKKKWEMLFEIIQTILIDILQKLAIVSTFLKINLETL